MVLRSDTKKKGQEENGLKEFSNKIGNWSTHMASFTQSTTLFKGELISETNKLYNTYSIVAFIEI